jgi:hypothetical protein
VSGKKGEEARSSAAFLRLSVHGHNTDELKDIILNLRDNDVVEKRQVARIATAAARFYVHKNTKIHNVPET